MDWWKWVLGIAGVIGVGLITNAIWDGIKAGSIHMRQVSRRRAALDAQSQQEQAADLAENTQRLLAWSMGIVMTAIGLFGIVGLLGIAANASQNQYAKTIWLFFEGVMLLIIVLAMSRAASILFRLWTAINE